MSICFTLHILYWNKFYSLIIKLEIFVGIFIIIISSYCCKIILDLLKNEKLVQWKQRWWKIDLSLMVVFLGFFLKGSVCNNCLSELANQRWWAMIKVQLGSCSWWVYITWNENWKIWLCLKIKRTCWNVYSVWFVGMRELICSAVSYLFT